MTSFRSATRLKPSEPAQALQLVDALVIRSSPSDSAVDLAQQVSDRPQRIVGGRLDGLRCRDAPSLRFLL
jgi:hypothetical protein